MKGSFYYARNFKKVLTLFFTVLLRLMMKIHESLSAVGDNATFSVTANAANYVQYVMQDCIGTKRLHSTLSAH